MDPMNSSADYGTQRGRTRAHFKGPVCTKHISGAPYREGIRKKLILVSVAQRKGDYSGLRMLGDGAL